MMKKIIFASVLVVGASLIFSGCARKQQTMQGTDQTVPVSRQKKVGNTTKTGKIVKIGNDYYIKELGHEPATIDSYDVDLGSYVGQTVTITGQYSGDTLFVGKISVK